MSDTKQQTTGAEGGFEFVTGDILDATGMVAKLRDPKDPLSRYLVGRFRPEATKALESFDGSRRRSDALVKALVEELNQVIADPDFYDAKRFEQVAPSGSTRILMDADPQRRQVVRLNALLLEDAFPTEILRNLSDEPKVHVERVQTGVRIERRMLKVLKALAEYDNMSLGELLEDIVLHAFEGVSTFDAASSRERIAALKGVYGMDYDAHAGRRFMEKA